MDREIDVSFRRKQMLRRMALTVALIALITTIFVWGPRLIQPSVARARIADLSAFRVEASVSGVHANRLSA